jgi:hypothetical protein
VASTIDGVVKLYFKTYYRDCLHTVNLNYINQCYHIGCSALDNTVEPAKWGRLLTSGTASIVFYEDFNCGGYSTTVTLLHFGAIVEGKIRTMTRTASLAAAMR